MKLTSIKYILEVGGFKQDYKLGDVLASDIIQDLVYHNVEIQDIKGNKLDVEGQLYFLYRLRSYPGIEVSAGGRSEELFSRILRLLTGKNYEMSFIIFQSLL